MQQLSQTPVDDTEAIKGITSQLQRIHLTDLPLVPLWYNGMWSQYNTSVWTSFPAAGTKSQFTPSVFIALASTASDCFSGHSK